MEWTRRQLLSATGVTIGLTGCLGNNTGVGTDEMEEPTIQTDSTDEYGTILVDAEGMTLYMFDQDTQGESMSACYDGCAEAWPPLTVEGEATASDDVTAELTTFDREDDTTQVAANGWPLYYYNSDEAPGDATGQGANDVWWVLDGSGTPKRPDSNDSSGIY